MSRLDIVSAAIVLSCGDHFLVQRKDSTYPVERFRGRLCLVGGSWTTAADRNPRDTALRELDEEVNPRVTRRDIRFLGAFDIRVPAASNGLRDTWILNFIYALEIDSDGHNLLEGEAAWFTWDALRTASTWCWGYDHVMAQCAPQLGRLWGAVGEVGVTCARRDLSDVDYTDMELDDLRLNPLRTGDVDEDALSG